MTNLFRRSFVRSAVAALLIVLTSLCGTTDVYAQSGEDLAKGLLRALIESTLEKDQRKRDRRDPFRSADPQPEQRQKLQQLRKITATCAQEASALSAVLNTDARRDYHVRHHLPAALQFEATATAVRRETTAATDPAELIDPCRQMNSQWLTLSYKLRNQHGVSPQTLVVLDRLEQLDSQYCEVLEIQQQFDNRQLVRTSDLLSAELRHLSEELHYTVPSSATRTRLIRQLQALQLQADNLANLVTDSRQPDFVVQEYRRLYHDWVVLESDLDRYRLRPITRIVQRVDAAQQTMHGLLRLEYGFDRRLARHLVSDVESTMSELFRQITLADLASLPDSEEILDATDTTYGTLQHLNDMVKYGETREEIGEAWVFMDEAWNLLAYYLDSMQHPQVQLRLEEIRRLLTALQQTVGVTVAWDHARMLHQASGLETIAGGILQAVQRWHRTVGVTDNRRIREARELVVHCHELEQRIARRRDQTQIHEKCDHITEAWQHLRSYLQECRTADRETLQRLAASFTPELVHIRTALPE
ncbi:MAG: hypothetical protein MK102_01200 [Fuerstiella sp.]|nr:hypothetical protein [Fuerstiella sp.]